MISQRQHLQIAAITWMMVGLMLTVRGAIWALKDTRIHHFVLLGLVLVAIAGILKGRFVLARTANRVIARIRTLDERSPFWKVYSPSMYLLVLGMITLGILCRLAGKYWHIFGAVGLLYVTIGFALLSGSLVYWRAMRHTA